MSPTVFSSNVAACPYSFPSLASDHAAIQEQPKQHRRIFLSFAIFKYVAFFLLLPLRGPLKKDKNKFAPKHPLFPFLPEPHAKLVVSSPFFFPFSVASSEKTEDCDPAFISPKGRKGQLISLTIATRQTIKFATTPRSPLLFLSFPKPAKRIPFSIAFSSFLLKINENLSILSRAFAHTSLPSFFLPREKKTDLLIN